MKNYKDISYFVENPEVSEIFDDLEEYLDFCRMELREYDPTTLYKMSSETYREFLMFKKYGDKYRNNRIKNIKHPNRKKYRAKKQATNS